MANEVKMPSATIEDTSQLNKDRENLINDIKQAKSLLNRQIRAAGIYQPNDMQYHNSFYRFRRMDPHFMVDGAFEYLFFTKPDLGIVKDNGDLTTTVSNDSNIYGRQAAQLRGGAAYNSYFNYLKKDGYDNTIRDLCASWRGHGGDSCPFVRILSNRKTSNMDVPDIVVNELETAQNMYGTRIFYPTSSMKSDEDVEFSIEFEDTQYLEVYQFFKAYDIYRQMKWLGLMSPKMEYVQNKILHDHMSIYKFLVANDGETILYYAKATGVYPKTISRSAFSELEDKGGLKITVSFKLSGWFEDMEPAILADFNFLARKTGWAGKGDRRRKEIWDSEIQAVSGESVKYFYVERIKQATSDKRNYYRYLLRAY